MQVVVSISGLAANGTNATQLPKGLEKKFDIRNYNYFNLYFLVSARPTPSLLMAKSTLSLLDEESRTNARDGAAMERKRINTKCIL